MRTILYYFDSSADLFLRLELSRHPSLIWGADDGDCEYYRVFEKRIPFPASLCLPSHHYFGYLYKLAMDINHVQY